MIVRNTIRAYVTVALLGVAPAMAQTPEPSPAQSSSSFECAGIGLVAVQVSVGGRRPRGAVLNVDGGSCGGQDVEGPPDGLSVVSYAPSGNGTEHEGTRVDDCPQFRPQALEVEASHQRGLPVTRRGPQPAVRVGLLTITDRAGYFDLRQSEGRHQAVKWLRETLVAVRPCWEKAADNDLGDLKSLNPFYLALGLRPLIYLRPPLYAADPDAPLDPKTTSSR